jgi:hypothetical protein
MKIPSSIRWKATGRALGEGGQAAVVEVEDSTGKIEGRYALKGLSPGRPPKAYERFARDALATVRHVRYLIASHYPPIELIGERCPLCGFGVVSDFQYSHAVFGNPLPPGIEAVKCSYCGYCYARSLDAAHKEQARREQLA